MSLEFGVYIFDKHLSALRFEHKPGKYRLVPEEERYFGKQVKDVKLFLQKSSHHSEMHPYVQDMMAELVSRSTSIYFDQSYYINIDWK